MGERGLKLNKASMQMAEILIFFLAELKLCSPRGKHTAKYSCNGARPPLQRAKMKKLFAIAEEHLQFDKATAHKELENFRALDKPAYCVNYETIWQDSVYHVQKTK